MKFKTFPFTGIYKQAMGLPETSGAWIIWGAEKNGKSWFALKVADYLSSFTKVLYISAEEGIGKDFVEACHRAKLQADNTNLMFKEYIPLDDLTTELNKRKSAKVIILDNCTIYADELKAAALRQLLQSFPDKLFIFVAHEEKKQPYTATAKLAKKLAKIIMHVQGLTAHISGRCPGGVITIDETKAALYWGSDIQTLNK